jgi:hypothetical protein
LPNTTPPCPKPAGCDPRPCADGIHRAARACCCAVAAIGATPAPLRAISTHLAARTESSEASATPCAEGRGLSTSKGPEPALLPETSHDFAVTHTSLFLD